MAEQFWSGFRQLNSTQTALLRLLMKADAGDGSGPGLYHFLLPSGSSSNDSSYIRQMRSWLKLTIMLHQPNLCFVVSIKDLPWAQYYLYYTCFLLGHLIGNFLTIFSDIQLYVSFRPQDFSKTVFSFELH